MNNFNIQLLTAEQKSTRQRILEISFQKKWSHLGSCLSSIDLIDGIYKVKNRDEKFILSNGHAGVALYVVLEKNGFIKNSDIETFHVHPDRNPELGIDVSTGSLGQGLPIALGMAMSDENKNVYCLISDGECTEGSIWETLRIASENNAQNLKIILNANGWGAYGTVDLSNLALRIESFGYKIKKIDGHNMSDIIKTLKSTLNDKLTVIFAQTSVNQFPFLKGQDAHYYIMTPHDYEEAIKLLKT
jgi:transketolase